MLGQRIATAVLSILVLLVALFALPPELTVVTFGVVLLAGAWEWAGFFDARPLWRLTYVLLIALCMALAWWLVSGVLSLEQVLWVAMLWWTVALLWLFVFPTPIGHLMAALCGVLVLIPAWLALARIHLLTVDGPQLVLFVLLVVWAADVGAYFFGRRFGRIKLAPAVSPGKTWEGVIGGVLVAGVVAVVGGWWWQQPLLIMLPLCFSIAAVSVVGDLTVSMFKRNAGLKDSGRLFPGHGGVLDRVDSVTAAAPLFALSLGWLV